MGDDALFLEVTGAINKKGTVYGMGNESEAYYERLTSACHSLRTAFPFCTFPNGSPVEEVKG